MLRVPHGENGAGGLTNDFFGNASHQHVRDGTAPVRSHDDQVDVLTLRIADNLDERTAPLGDEPRAEALPFGDGEFDAALAQLVVPWMSDPAGGVAEMRRVVRPGGVVAACTWDFASGMTMLRTFWDAAVAVDRSRATQAGALHRTRLCDPDELRELWAQIGLLAIDAGELVVGADYADFDDFWWPFSAGVGGSGRYCASLDEAGREALREEVRRRLGSPTGRFRLTARAWYVRGRRPGADPATTQRSKETTWR